jgi:hypothetical protein
VRSEITLSTQSRYRRFLNRSRFAKQQRAAQSRPETKIQFMEIARRDGLKAALAWRDARLPGRTP